MVNAVDFSARDVGLDPDRPSACFQRNYLRLELNHVNTWIRAKPDWQTNKVHIGKTQSVGATIKGCPVYL